MTVGALRTLGLVYPILDHDAAWETITHAVVHALNQIHEAAHDTVVRSDT